MKIDRLIGILTILLRQEKATMPALADRFEVSRRTIARDVEDLCKAGIPIVTTQGSGGGVLIAPGYKLDKTLLTREELQAVLAGLRGLDSVSFRPHARLLEEKLSGNHQRLQVEDCIVIDLASYYRDSLSEKIELIRQAIANHKMVEFCYYAPNGESKRTVEPYLLVFRWGNWYLYSYCIKKNGYRLFKLNRIWELNQTLMDYSPRPLDNPPDFEAFLKEEPILFRALFEPEAKYRLIEEYGMDYFTKQPDQRLLFEFQFANAEVMRQWVLSFGAQVRVIQPVSLAEDIRRQAEEILKREKQT